MVQNRALPAAARRAQILDQIERTGGITIGEVVRVHAVSPLTVHRDLEQLARDGLIERVRGGAHAVERPRRRTVHSTAWEHRIAQAPEAKAAIARHAITLIPESATVFLDASSTALALAVTLMDRPPHELTVVTNSPMIAANVCADPIHVVVCPGELDHQMRAVTGQWTVEFIGRLRFDMAFISGAGITLDAGLTTSRGPISDVLNAARAAAGRTMALVDSTKFGRATLVSIAQAREFELLVTDDGLAAEVADKYRAAGVRLTAAPRAAEWDTQRTPG